MLAVAVNGSPHKKGNTYDLLNLALKPLQQAGWETKILQLGGTDIKPCSACFGCYKKKNNSCVLPHDSFHDIMPELLKADAMLLGCPTYFANITGEMKCLIDRVGLVSMANNGLLRAKIGAAVVPARRAGGLVAVDAINRLFLGSGVIVPGSTYWNVAFGLAPGQALQDKEGTDNISHLGQAIAWLGQAMAPHRESFPPPLA